MSGKEIVDSGMIYRKENVSMGIPGNRRIRYLPHTGEEIRQAKKLMEEKACLRRRTFRQDITDSSDRGHGESKGFKRPFFR